MAGGFQIAIDLKKGKSSKLSLKIGTQTYHCSLKLVPKQAKPKTALRLDLLSTTVDLCQRSQLAHALVNLARSAEIGHRVAAVGARERRGRW